jgi:hypothetical protein
LDEPWIHSTYAVSAGKIVRHGVIKNNSAGHRWIIVCAGSENKSFHRTFLSFKPKTRSGNYCNEMNFENFSNCIEKQLLCNLPPECLIVLDIVSCYSVKIDKPPSLAPRKGDI